MSEMPDDIMATAKAAWNVLPFSHVELCEDVTVGVIARAILAERERCRLIAVDVAQEADGGEYYIAHLIASAIHTPSKPERTTE